MTGGDSGTRCARPFLATSAGMVHQPSARSAHFSLQHLVAPLGGQKPQLERGGHYHVLGVEHSPQRTDLVLARTRSRWRSFAGIATPVAGLFSTRPRPMPTLKIFDVSALTRLARIGAPRSTMRSRSSATSRRRMPSAGRSFQAGRRSTFKFRSIVAPGSLLHLGVALEVDLGKRRRRSGWPSAVAVLCPVGRFRVGGFVGVSRPDWPRPVGFRLRRLRFWWRRDRREVVRSAFAFWTSAKISAPSVRERRPSRAPGTCRA